MSALRDELRRRLEALPEEDLAAIAPILRLLDDRNVIVENDLDDEEKRIVQEGREAFQSAPGSFVYLEELERLDM